MSEAEIRYLKGRCAYLERELQRKLRVRGVIQQTKDCDLLLEVLAVNPTGDGVFVIVGKSIND